MKITVEENKNLRVVAYINESGNLMIPIYGTGNSLFYCIRNDGSAGPAKVSEEYKPYWTPVYEGSTVTLQF